MRSRVRVLVISSPNHSDAAVRIGDLVAEFAAVVRLCLDNTTVFERLQGTGPTNLALWE